MLADEATAELAHDGVLLHARRCHGDLAAHRPVPACVHPRLEAPQRRQIGQVANGATHGGTAGLVLTPDVVHGLARNRDPTARFAGDLDHASRVRTVPGMGGAMPGDTVWWRDAVSPDPVSVRPLATPTRGELEALAELFDAYRVHYGEDPDVPGSARWLDENLGASRLRAFVAEGGGRLVGFAITTEVPASLRLARFWQIRDLFVVPTHRRRGVGRALLASVRAAAVESGALRLVAQTEDDNEPAVRLYTDSGFAPIEGYRSLVLPICGTDDTPA